MLARGGMAEVFLARMEGVGGLEKLFVIKRMLPHLNEDPEFHEMFLNEGRITARLKHPKACVTRTSSPTPTARRCRASIVTRRRTTYSSRPKACASCSTLACRGC